MVGVIKSDMRKALKQKHSENNRQINRKMEFRKTKAEAGNSSRNYLNDYPKNQHKTIF